MIRLSPQSLTFWACFSFNVSPVAIWHIILMQPTYSSAWAELSTGRYALWKILLLLSCSSRNLNSGEGRTLLWLWFSSPKAPGWCNTASLELKEVSSFSFTKNCRSSASILFSYFVEAYGPGLDGRRSAAADSFSLSADCARCKLSSDKHALWYSVHPNAWRLLGAWSLMDRRGKGIGDKASLVECLISKGGHLGEISSHSSCQELTLIHLPGVHWRRNFWQFWMKLRGMFP